MSVTFTAYTPEGKEVVPEGWQPIYEKDEMYGFPPTYMMQTNQNPLSLNVSNQNYCSLMGLIGLNEKGEMGYCGTWGDGSLQHVADQIRFVLNGLQGMPKLDGGTPTETLGGDGKCTMVMCGVRPGYYQERLASLLEIVEAAIKVGGIVNFG